MLETIQSMLLDFWEIELETGVPRHLRIKTVPGKATVCIGVRRSGKSTYLFQRIEALVANGVARQNILYLNFFDDRLHQLGPHNLGLVTEAYFSLFPEKKNAEQIYCFFDEIQTVPGWEAFIDRLLRTENCEIYITGSSANMLATELATQMRGRSLSWEIFPFSFGEFLDHQGIARTGALSAKKRLIVQNAFDKYWKTGGFPEVIGLDRRLRIKIHQEYLNAILFRDLVERHDISHPRAVSDLAHWLIDNAASLYSINRLTGYLKSLGHRVPKSAVSDYLHWFEDAYFLFTTRLYDSSLNRSNTNPKKIYCVDHSLITSTSSGILVNTGHLLENLVFVALRQAFSDIHYYKTKSGLEVDFIVTGKRREPILVQVCDSLADPRTHKREITSLGDAMAELGIQVGTIVTRTDRERVVVSAGTIEIMPAWQFLLNNIDNNLQ